jgi:curved DNA-binding protein
MSEHDYYRVLGLSQDASDDEIKKAYRRLALEFHPDHHPADPGSEERFKRVSEAYSVLGDTGKRLKYDLRFRRAGDRGEVFAQSAAEDMFQKFLEWEGFDVRKARCISGGRGCGRRGSEVNRNVAPDGDPLALAYEVSLTRVEAACGAQKEIVMTTPGNPRTYAFKIPAGVASGDQFRLVLDRRKRMSVLVRIKIDENGREVTADSTKNDTGGGQGLTIPSDKTV